MEEDMSDGVYLGPVQRGSVPANLTELMEQSQADYKLQKAYFLELEHGLMGFFPAIFRGTERIVITTDHALLQEIWRNLPPRQSKMRSNNFLVNDDLRVGFPILEDGQENYSKPQRLLMREEFESLGPTAFEWAPGLIGNDMNHEEFLRTLDVAIRQGPP